MTLKIIAAIAQNGVIGRGNSIPWNLRSDLKQFQEQTMGYPVVMGKRTFDSIINRLGKPLPGRENIVLTRHPGSIRCDGVTTLDSWNKVVERAEGHTLFVAGGAEIYKLALPVADEMYLTRVFTAPGGDTFFPSWDEKEWTRISSAKELKDEKNEFDYMFEHYIRRASRYIEMGNIRTPQQMEDMREILELGVCPFCEDFIKHSKKWHRQPFLWTGVHWVVTYNNYPYPWTKPVIASKAGPEDPKVHLLLVLKTHAETMAEVPSGAFAELDTITKWAEREYNIEGGGLFMRFGEPLWTGGTVRHLHAHIAQRKDLRTEAKFYLE